MKKLTNNSLDMKKSEKRVLTATYVSLMDKVMPIGYISSDKMKFGKWRKLFYKDASSSYAKCYQRIA